MVIKLFLVLWKWEISVNEKSHRKWHFVSFAFEWKWIKNRFSENVDIGAMFMVFVSVNEN